MRSIDKALRVMDRAGFLPPAMQGMKHLDIPLQIGFGQTNSQPSTVRQMLEWLDVQAGQRVLDVGSGSGWTAALLAYLVGDEGEVVAVEKVPQLLKFGAANAHRAGARNVMFHQAGRMLGWPPRAPYDRILVSAAAPALPRTLVRQLAADGRLVVPVDESIYVIDRRGDSFKGQRHDGYVFVPLVS